MKKENISDALNNIDFDMVEDVYEGTKTNKKKPKSIWLKWSVMAACFCLIVTAGFAGLPYLMNRSFNNSAEAFIISSYNDDSLETQASLIVTVDVSKYMNKTEKDGILDIQLGIATKNDYSHSNDYRVPLKTTLTISSNGLCVGGIADIFVKEYDITDPKYQCIQGTEAIFGENNPSHHENISIDFSLVKSGDSGEIMFTLENTYSDYENEEAVITIFYAVKEDLIVFSPTSVEEAKSNAEIEYDKIFSWGYIND